MTGGALLKHHEKICGEKLPEDPLTTDPCTLGIIALIQIMMAAMLLILRFTKLASYMKILLSKPLVAGFTSAASIYVLFSQFNNLFGFNSPMVNKTIPRYSESFALAYVIRDFASQITSIQIFTFFISLVSCASLYSGKRIHEWYKSKTGSKMAWPLELVLLFVTTLISFLMKFDKNHGVSVVGDIPQGLPPLAVSSFSSTFTVENAKLLLMDSFSILIVNFSICLSMGEMFANKFNYKLNPNSEAHGLSFSLITCSLFGGVTAAAALARSMVQAHSGGYTQIVSFVSSFWLVLVLIFLAPYLFWLPKAVLSSVIVVNLRSLFLKYPDAWQNLYKKRRYADFCLFVVTNASVLFLGLDTGLYIALVTELFIVFFRLRASFGLNVHNEFIDGDSVQVVSLSGSILFGNSSDVEKELKELDFSSEAVLNLTGLTYLDHTGYDILKNFLKRFEKIICADKKMALKLLNFTEKSKNEETESLKQTKVYPTLLDAVADSDIVQNSVQIDCTELEMDSTKMESVIESSRSIEKL